MIGGFNDSDLYHLFPSQALPEEDQIIKLEASCMWMLGCRKT